MKKCRICKQEFPEDNFYKSSARTRDGLRHECKSCYNSKSLDYYSKNKETLSSKRKDYYYRSKYGLSVGEVSELKTEFNNECYICGEKETVVDHCHTTGKVRGVLCNRCNQGLGSFRDNKTYLKKAIRYLDKLG